jgi:hypothetical protein
MSPPTVTPVPETFTAETVDILLPAFVAVLPDILIPAPDPSKSKLAPATYMAPPRLPAELFVKLVVATVVAKDSTEIPPAMLAELLFEIIEVPKFAEPLPMPPGAPNAKV